MMVSLMRSIAGKIFDALDYLLQLSCSHRAKIMQVSVTEAAANLNELIQAAIDGEEVIVLNGDRPAIKLTPIEKIRPDRKPGSAKGPIWVSDDFDEPLEEFKEYLE
jgi:antitoxin (DNA-binding transcriptional repressor) of toxin-antitoxin stability system